VNLDFAAAGHVEVRMHLRELDGGVEVVGRR
jgi:hypothetical protein